MSRIYRDCREGGQVYVWWDGAVRPATVARLREADDGSQDLAVPPGHVRVRFHHYAGGSHNVALERVRGETPLFATLVGDVT